MKRPLYNTKDGHILFCNEVNILYSNYGKEIIELLEKDSKQLDDPIKRFNAHQILKRIRENGIRKLN